MKSSLVAGVVLCLLILSPVGSLLAQDLGVPDTVYFGDHGKAYGLTGGVFKIPVYVWSDQQVKNFVCGMEYGVDNPNIIFDSTTTAFADPVSNQVFDLLSFNDYNSSDDGIPPDTLGLAALSIFQMLPPGLHKLGDVVFHGAQIGEYVTVDSATFPPGNPPALFSDNGYEYTPQFVGGSLEIIEAPGEFYLLTPTEYAGDAGYPIGMMIEVISGLDVVNVVLDSIVNAATGVHIAQDSLPEVVGLNPSQTTWTPNTLQFGIWYAYFRVLDTFSNVLAVEIKLNVYQLPANCDIVRGDLNCDGLISVSDAVYIINYLFGGGPPPGCN